MVIKLKNGMYKVDVSLGKDETTGKRKRIIRKGIYSYKKAKEIEQELINCDLNIQDKLSFSDVFLKYIESKKKSLKINSINKKISIYRNYFCIFFVNRNIKEIIIKDIEKFKEFLFDKNISNNYRRYIMVELSSFFNFCIRYAYVSANPVKSVSFFKKERKEMNYWTIDEFKQFIRIVDEPIYELLYTLLFFTGMRKGEALALTWNDVDFNKREIYIRNSCSYVSKVGYVISTPKTEESKRTIVINNNLISLLLKFYDACKNNTYDFSDENYIFSESNVILSKTTIFRKFKEYIKMAKVKSVRIHDLRHSHVALLIYLKQEPLSIKKRLGHSDIGITLNTYGHLYNDEEKKMVKLLDNL